MYELLWIGVYLFIAAVVLGPLVLAPMCACRAGALLGRSAAGSTLMFALCALINALYLAAFIERAPGLPAVALVASGIFAAAGLAARPRRRKTSPRAVPSR